MFLSRGAAAVAAVSALIACSSGSGGGGGLPEGGAGTSGTAGSGGTGGNAGSAGTGGSGGVKEAGVCKIDGQTCLDFGECCTGACSNGRCGGVACVGAGKICASFDDCCSGNCAQGTCSGAAEAGVGYPSGPYGVDMGDTLANAAFQGFLDFGASQLATIQFGDFYNPSDDPQKPKLLVIALMTLWATPAQAQEQQADVAYWHGQRVEFLSVHSDGATPGQAITEVELATWAGSLNPANSHPLLMDPQFTQLAELFAASGQAVPFSIVVDARTMKILAHLLGVEQFDASNATLQSLAGS